VLHPIHLFVHHTVTPVTSAKWIIRWFDFLPKCDIKPLRTHIYNRALGKLNSPMNRGTRNEQRLPLVGQQTSGFSAEQNRTYAPPHSCIDVRPITSTETVAPANSSQASDSFPDRSLAATVNAQGPSQWPRWRD
jgi:hypothetical protein